MHSLYNFPLNGACVLCKTAWPWYGARVQDSWTNMTNCWESTLAGLLTEMLAQVMDSNTAWKLSYSDAVQGIGEIMTKVSLSGFSCSSHQWILHRARPTCTCPPLNAESTDSLHKLFGIFILPRNHLIYPTEIIPKCFLSKRPLVLHSTDHPDCLG